MGSRATPLTLWRKPRVTSPLARGEVDPKDRVSAFIVILPLLLNQAPAWLGIPISTALASHLEFMIFGALIVFFLIVEPHGLARLWSIAKDKLRLWPFPH